MNRNLSRRDFVAASVALLAAPPRLYAESEDPPDLPDESWFDISVAQWSFQREFYAGTMKSLEFPEFCRTKLGIYAVDYLSDFLLDDYRDASCMKRIRDAADANGVENVMIMCHKVGDVGHADGRIRNAVMEDHFRWIEAARNMGCSMVRVNVRSSGSREEQKSILADSLRRMCLFARDYGVSVIVENLWGSEYSYKADFIAELMQEVDLENCGTLPDFNNFRYDNVYDSVRTMMPWAKSVSAKSLTFTPAGLEKYIDYHRMIQIVFDSGYRGFVGIEYEGCKAAPTEGVLLTKSLLEDARRSVLS